MQVLWGVVITALSLLCWGGQTIALLSPRSAVRLGLSEAARDVEPLFWSDSRGEALWDVLTLWTALAAGVLLILDESAWAYFGLVGGGMYVYFGGRGIATRVTMLRAGFRIGSRRSVRVGLVFLAVWGVMGLAMVIAAIVGLQG